MRVWTLSLLLVLLISCARLVNGQKPQSQPPPTVVQTTPLARLSYKGVGFPQVCFALGKDGNYLMWSSMPSGQYETLGGILQQDQRKQLQQLLEGVRKMPASGPIVVHREAQAFVAEFPKGMSTNRRSWVADSDGENTFPAPITKIVRWLQQFKPEHTRRLNVHINIVCPTGELKSLMPAADSGPRTKRAR